MSLKNQGGIINIGTYNDNSREYNIDARGKELSSILQECETEEVIPVQEEKPQKPEFFCRITKAAIACGKAQAVEDELRKACVSAPKLVKTIRTNEALGYLDTENLNSSDLFDMLNEHFHLPFKLRTFQDSRSK